MQASPKQKQPQSFPSFWDKLQQDVDKIKNRAKQKLSIYEQKKYQTIRNKQQNSRKQGNRQQGKIGDGDGQMFLYQTSNTMQTHGNGNKNNKTTVKFNIGRSNKPSTLRAQQQQQQNMIKVTKIASSPNNKSFDTISHMPHTIPENNSLKRRQLIELVKNQNKKRLQMKNRLAYMHESKQRQNKTIQLAKKKFEHIVQVRTQNFKEKQILKKRENKNYKSGIVNSIKIQRQKRNMSLQSYKCSVSERASSIRAESLNNQSFTNFQRIKSRQQNAQRARKTKDSIKKSRSIVYEVQHKKIQNAKNQRNNQLTDRLMALNQQKKNNQMIFNKLRLEAQKINRWKNKAQRQIEQYRTYLGLTTRNPQMKNSSKVSQKSLKPFYITSHY